MTTLDKITKANKITAIEKHKKELKLDRLRQQYRLELIEARQKYGQWIPFGYNLDILKNHKIPINKEERYVNKLKYE